MKHLRLAVNNIKLAIYHCHPGACQTTQKPVHFYLLITLKHKKVVEKFVKKKLFYGEKHSFIEWTYVVGAHWSCLYEVIPMCYNVPTTYVTEIKEIYFEIYSKQVSCPLAFLF